MDGWMDGSVGEFVSEWGLLGGRKFTKAYCSLWIRYGLLSLCVWVYMYLCMSCELSSKLNSSVGKNSKHPRSHCTSFSSHHDGAAAAAAAEAESGRGVNKNADQSRNLQFMDRMNGY